MRESPGYSGFGHRVSRRTFFEFGVATLLGVSAVASIVRCSGYAIAPGRRLTTMSTWQFVVAQHAARRIAAPDRAGDPTIPTADDADVAGFIDTFLERVPPNLRRDLGRFLAYLEHLAPLRLGCIARFTRLGAAEQDRVLTAIEGSSSDLLRAAFDGLKSLCLMGYYRHPRTWSIVSYDGPLVGRPASGWAGVDP